MTSQSPQPIISAGSIALTNSAMLALCESIANAEETLAALLPRTGTQPPPAHYYAVGTAFDEQDDTLRNWLKDQAQKCQSFHQIIESHPQHCDYGSNKSTFDAFAEMELKPFDTEDAPAVSFWDELKTATHHHQGSADAINVMRESVQKLASLCDEMVQQKGLAIDS